MDANSSINGNQAFVFIGTDTFTGTAGELRYRQVGDYTYIQADTDGNGMADFLVRLDGLHTLIAADFLL